MEIILLLVSVASNLHAINSRLDVTEAHLDNLFIYSNWIYLADIWTATTFGRSTLLIKKQTEKVTFQFDLAVYWSERRRSAAWRAPLTHQIDLIVYSLVSLKMQYLSELSHRNEIKFKIMQKFETPIRTDIETYIVANATCALGCIVVCHHKPSDTKNYSEMMTIQFHRRVELSDNAPCIYMTDWLVGRAVLYNFLCIVIVKLAVATRMGSEWQIDATHRLINIHFDWEFE